MQGQPEPFYGIHQRYYFPKMRKLVQQFIEQCTVCQIVKTPRANQRHPIHMSIQRFKESILVHLGM